MKTNSTAAEPGSRTPAQVGKAPPLKNPVLPMPFELPSDNHPTWHGLPMLPSERKHSSKPRRRRGHGTPAAIEYLSSFLCPLLLLFLAVTGCTGPRALRGGNAVTVANPSGAIEQALAQGENAAHATKQALHSVRVRSYTLPPGSRIEQSRIQLLPSGLPFTNHDAVVVSALMPVVERDETQAQTELGAAQKDMAREVGAKLASLKAIVWVGLGLSVFGLATLVWPPLRALVASVTTSIGLMVGGVALMVLPSLVVGNELLILGIVAALTAAWFLAHRHGQVQGLLAASIKPTTSATPDSRA